MFWKPVISGINAEVISGLINPYPVSFCNSTNLGTCSKGEGRGNFNPAILLLSDDPNFFGNFREVLILAKNEGNIISPSVSQSYDIKGDSDVYPLFPPCPYSVRLPSRKVDLLILISQIP